MPLSAGTRLGPYEILAPIGAGGMGEVYRARDTKLECDVAIKVLPAVLAQARSVSRVLRAKPRCWPRSIIPTSRRFTGSKIER